MTYSEVAKLVAKIQTAATRYECDLIPEEPVVRPPCEASELTGLESHFGGSLPKGVKEFFTTTSAHVEFSWHLIGNFPEPFSGITCGAFTLSPQSIISADEGRAGWAKEVYPDIADPYDKLWQCCRGLMDLECGDFLAWDDEGRIVYLSHDGMVDWHGYVIATSFESFVRDYLLLGAPEPEFGWDIFTANSNSGISTASKEARLWLDLFFGE